MAAFSIENIAIKGITACVPNKVESNYDIDYINAKELEFLIKNVGVKEKRKVADSVTCSDLCFRSAQKLLAELSWDPAGIDLLIYVSQSRDYIIPCTAIILQDRLGLSRSCLAFDIPLGCSGYTYGLSAIAGLMSSTRIKRGLLLSGDTSTLLVSVDDKKAFPLFGDAGSATALEFNEGCPPMIFDAGSDGSGYESIIIPGGGSRNPLGEETEYARLRLGQQKGSSHLHMDGMKVFEFAISRVPSSISMLMQKAAVSATDIDHFIMHQANLLLNETIRKKLKFSEAQVCYSLEKFGNTSAASIPLTMVTELRQQLQSKKNKLLMSGFGVGLSWSNVLVDTDSLIIPELIEYD